jgi:hypothetical protein
MEACNDGPKCPTCLSPTARIYTAPYVTTTTFLDAPANKEALKAADARRDKMEARYAASWDR